MDTVRIGVIGLGARGLQILKDILLKMGDVQITAVCDSYEDRVDDAAKAIVEAGQAEPFKATDYREVLACGNVDAISIYTAWDMHAEIAIASMRAGIPVASEVGSEYSINNCWQLVRTHEETGTPYMFMENCCFGKDELLATAMMRHGLFGEVVHCSGVYGHDLRKEVAEGIQNRHYRFRNYRARNCENYPTHELGPMAMLLNINRGNRMVSLTSVASKAAGLKAYIEETKDKVNYSDEVLNATFKQGDIVQTLVTCENGETMLLTLDTTLPRYYTRGFTVRGTKGFYQQETNSVFIDGVHPEECELDTYRNYQKFLNNATEYENDYLPSIWKDISDEVKEMGHGGMDYFTHRAFIEAVKNGTPMPLDVYDAAAWMAVSVLSEQSIREGGSVQQIPDFTNGKWMFRPAQDVVKL